MEAGSTGVTAFPHPDPYDKVALALLMLAARCAVWAGVAQLVEHLICNQRVGGSNPFVSSICKPALLERQIAVNWLCCLSLCGLSEPHPTWM